jgi:hypothetical protein
MNSIIPDKINHEYEQEKINVDFQIDYVDERINVHMGGEQAFSITAESAKSFGKVLIEMGEHLEKWATKKN